MKGTVGLIFGIVVVSLFLATRLCAPAPRWVDLELSGQSWRFQVADNQIAWECGLSGQQLAPNTGMIFYFGTTAPNREFWMKDMIIDLDMVWLDPDGQVVATAENVPHPDCGDVDRCPPARRSTAAESRFVLEVPAGTLATLPEPLQSVNVATLGP